MKCRSDLHLPEPTFVDIEGVAIATYDLAPKNRQPSGVVVFCHGTPWSAAVWAPVARILSARRRVLLWDMPGYGSSSMTPAAPVDLPAQWRRLRLLIESLAPEGAALVAHDIGGAVALGAHLMEDLDVAGIFLLDAVTLDPWGSPFFTLVREHVEVFGALPADLHRALVTAYIRGAAGHDLGDEVVDVLVAPWATPVGQRAFYRQIAQLRTEDTAPIVDRLGAMRCPVAIGWGEDDPWLPSEQAHRLADRLPGTPQVSVVPGVGHLGPLESPDHVGRIVGDWLDQVLGS